ncbi:unnamed protein product [Prunus armeniaca]
MSVILQSLTRSGIPVPQFDASTSEPVHPEHGHQTSAPVDNVQTSELHLHDDHDGWNRRVSGMVRKKDVICESDMKDAIGVSLPLIYAAVNSIQREVFPKSCLLDIEIPSSPLTNKGSLDPYNLDEEKDNVYIMDPLGARHPHDVWKRIVNAMREVGKRRHFTPKWNWTRFEMNGHVMC